MKTRPVLLTITRANDQPEADLLRECLVAAAARCEMVVAADSSTTANLQQQINNVPNLQLHRVDSTVPRTLVGQLITAIRHLPEPAPEWVVYSEPNKLEFFQRHLEPFIAKASTETTTGVVLAARDRAGFQTFPRGQRLTERATNRLAGVLLGMAGDYCYGPMLIRTELLRRLKTEPDIFNLGWGWRFLVMGWAVRSSLEVRHITLPVSCPLHERDEDDHAARLYRLQQMGQNLEGLHRGLS